MKTALMLPTLLLLLLLIATHDLSAQELTVAWAEAGAQAVAHIGPAQVPEFGLIAIEPFDMAPAVKGAPYSAEAVTESTQVLADGNRIEQSTSTTIARDSSGRVRRQQQGVVFGGVLANAQAPLVTISDPTGTHITLDTERHVAFRMKAPPLPPRGDFDVTAADVAGGQPSTRLEFRVGGDMPTPNATPAPSLAFGIQRRNEAPGSATLGKPDVHTERLGERVFEGVRADGTRTTMTIPANTIGNREPIAVVSERWYSPELQVVVFSRRSDPRFGDSVYRLINIVRAEPPTDLFEIPSDYRIEDQTMSRGRRIDTRVP